MRLIDADELKKDFDTYYVSDKYGYEKIDEREVVERINAMPTFIIQIPTAHWVPKGRPGSLFVDSMRKCSRCGAIVDLNCVNFGRVIARYCPNCGAAIDNKGGQI